MTAPVAGKNTDARNQRLVISQTSLISSEVEPLILEAHPGSPVDLSGCRPSLAASMASASLYRPMEKKVVDSYRFQTSPTFLEDSDDVLKGDDVAAKESNLGTDSQRVIHTSSPAQSPTFYVPAKYPEHDEVHTILTPVCLGEDKSSDDATMKVPCPEPRYSVTGVHAPSGHGSGSSFATTATCVSETPPNDNASVPNSPVAISDGSASMLSSSATSVVSSTVSINSSDLYGWEEELDRKSAGAYSGWERQATRPLPSGGRSGYQATRVPRIRPDNHPCQVKRVEFKRRGLLYRVLNLSRDHKRTPVIEEERTTALENIIEPPKPTVITSAIGIDS